jgi:Ni,Fe-hydrogenase III small subunit/formate hydrogenlyase subunit 6/NADH:ubiquinone oxidoreductase subunit I
MLKLLRASLHGRVTTAYPNQPAEDSFGRGVPVVDPELCGGLGDCARVCPSGAIAARNEPDNIWSWRIDLSRCLFCGLCAEACSLGAIRIGHEFELAARTRDELVRRIDIELPTPSSTAQSGDAVDGGPRPPAATSGADEPDPAEAATNGAEEARPSTPAIARVVPEREALGRRIRSRLSRSLHIRHMAAGSENACDWEIAALLGPVYDVQRLGIDFVASPRHADLLLVTGAVTRNLEPALLATYEAMPSPRLVVAVGDEACSGGILQGSYACAGGVDKCLPVDVYIPGDPPSPRALIHGLLLALDKISS